MWKRNFPPRLRFARFVLSGLQGSLLIGLNLSRNIFYLLLSRRSLACLLFFLHNFARLVLMLFCSRRKRILPVLAAAPPRLVLLPHNRFRLIHVLRLRLILFPLFLFGYRFLLFRLSWLCSHFVWRIGLCQYYTRKPNLN